MEEVVLSVLVRIIGGSHNVERGSASQHLIQEHTKGPPIHREPVVLRPEDLRGDIVGGPAEGGGRVPGPCDGNSIIIKPETVSLPDPLFAHPVVGELDVALVV